jgi:8-oxo-dGTP pyrophosphatase MutT (NUDIX family)
MYKVFSGEKCIMISANEINTDGKISKTVEFTSAEALHNEYKLFERSSKLKNLIILGNEGQVWRVFQSLFSYIEAAGGLVFNAKSELLMIYRNKHWDIPKGKMEEGETPEQTALREVEEECGIKKLRIVRPLNSSYHIFFQNGKHCMKRTYWFEMECKDTSKLSPQKEEGIEEAKWMSRAEAKKILGKVYLSLQEVLTTTFFA